MAKTLSRTRVALAALAALTAVVALAGGPTACRAPTQITVALSTDVKCADDRGVVLTVGDLAGLDARPITTTTDACADGRIGELVVVPSGADDDTVAIKVVMGLGRDPAECVPLTYGPGCVVARRALRYIPHTRLTLPVFLSAACNGVACGETETCVGGDCRPATIPDPQSCTGAEGCAETALAPPTADAAADVPAPPPPPPPAPPPLPPPGCGTGTTCVTSLPAGWSPLAFAPARAAACPADWSTIDLVTVAASASSSCACKCQIAPSDPPSCAMGSIASLVGTTTCNTNGETYTVDGTGCTALSAVGSVTPYGNDAPLPLHAGTCVSSAANVAGATTSDPVRACAPPPSCADDLCNGAAPAGFASCIVHDADVACPTPFATKTLAGDAVSVACSGCATCANQATCPTAILRFYDDAACATELASRVANGACNPLASGAAGTTVSRFRYDAAPVSPTCTPTSTPTAAPSLAQPRTICCR